MDRVLSEFPEDMVKKSDAAAPEVRMDADRYRFVPESSLAL